MKSKEISIIYSLLGTMISCKSRDEIEELCNATLANINSTSILAIKKSVPEIINDDWQNKMIANLIANGKDNLASVLKYLVSDA